MEKDLLERKINLEARLQKYGIEGYQVTYLPYLEFDDAEFATPYEMRQDVG